MKKKDFAIFAACLKTFYPKEKLFETEQAVELWFQQLKDIDINVLKLALSTWVATEKWSPTIADLREKAAEIEGQTPADWSNGWDNVQKAIRYYGRYRQAEALESMDEITRQTVSRMGFIELCNSENVAADRANFRTIYQSIAERKKRENQIPVEVMALIEQVKGGTIHGRIEG